MKISNCIAHISLNCGLVVTGCHHCRFCSQCPCVFFRSDLVEKNAMLRTKAMREREEQRERRKYNYTLLRIRLPDGNLLQGKSLWQFRKQVNIPALIEVCKEDVCFQGPSTRGTGCLCCLGSSGSRWWTAGSPSSSLLLEVRNYKSQRKSLLQSVTWWVETRVISRSWSA